MYAEAGMHPGFVVAIEMLPTPKVNGLTDEQIDGTRCVWCHRKPQVGIGPRLCVLEGELRRWKPRACNGCVKREALTTYGNHIRTCAHCTPQAYCVDARALYQLAH